MVIDDIQISSNTLLMKSNREKVEINASSMADIAFLLLIFFLVTTTIDTDKGIIVKLPKWDDLEREQEPINKRNVLEILINGDNNLMVEGQLTPVDELKRITFDFLDNNGEHNCSYCSGSKSTTSSDHPQKAVVSLLSHRSTSYETYIKIYDEVIGAYHHLRDIASINRFKIEYDQLLINQKDSIIGLYPMLLSEAEPMQ